MSISLSGRPAFGLGLSVLAHVAVLAWLVQAPPPAPAPDAPASRMQVTLLRLAPPRPAAVPAPVLPPPAKAMTSPKPAASLSPARPSLAAAAEAAAAEPPPIVMLPMREDSGAASEPAPTQAGAFDLQAARGAARAFARTESAGGGADGRGRPMRATRDEKLGDAIERSRPADCRHAYSGMGVLALIPLAASAVTGKGCKW